jgi:hypothetical protein
MDEESKTAIGGPKAMLLVAMSQLETRLEELNKRVAELGSISPAGLVLIRTELGAIQQRVERALAAVEQVERGDQAPAAPRPKVPDRF